MSNNSNMHCQLCKCEDVIFKGARKVCQNCIDTIINNLTSNDEKICEYCGKKSCKSDFSTSPLASVCKECTRQYKLDCKKERYYKTYKKYYQENREKLIEKTKKWNKNNKAKRNIHKQNYRNKHKDELDFRIKENLGTRLRNLVKKDNNNFIDFIGCEISFLKKWLEYNFVNDMSWTNYGSYWHIDHIIPCATYKEQNIQEQLECWKWTNLAPLEAKSNASKGCKIDNNIINYYKKRVEIFLSDIGEGSESIRQQAN